MLDQALNFRAVRPYPAAGGRLRDGWLYRSGTFEAIGPEGARALAALGVRSVFDLRTAREATQYPSPVASTGEVRLIAAGHDVHLGDLTRLIADPATSPAGMRAAMIAVYREMPRRLTPVLGRAVQHVAAAGAPVVVNCTAGKDRTGAVVALVLSALGVARDDILEDYLLSNQAVARLRAVLRGNRGGLDFSQISPEALEPMNTVDAAYLDAFFDEIAQNHGDVEAYLSRELGLTPAKRDAMAAALLE